MMLVPAYVAPSRIEGVGVFAAEDIAPGSLIWCLNPNLDRLLSPTEIAALPALHRDFAECYGYPYPRGPSVTIIERSEFDPSFAILPGRIFLNASLQPSPEPAPTSFGQ
jgi:hypothetical protein